MPEINPLSNEQIFLKKIAENTGSNYETGDVSEINPITIDQIFLKEIAANTAGQSGDITELEGKVADNTSAIEAIVNEYGAKNLALLKPSTGEHRGVNFSCTDGMTISVNGISTASEGAYSSYTFTLVNAIEGNLIVSLTPSSQKISLSYSDGTNWYEMPSDGRINGTIAIIGFNVASGQTIDETVKLMIRDARITDPTYVPYAMTNRELTDAVNRGSVSVTADGVKTYKQLLNELYALVDFNKVTGLSYLRAETSYLYTCTVAGGYYGNASVYNGMPQIISVYLDANDSLYNLYYEGANHDEKNTVAPSGRTFILYY